MVGRQETVEFIGGQSGGTSKFYSYAHVLRRGTFALDQMRPNSGQGMQEIRGHVGC